ncbi:phage tail sheath subtilisin-like domain-containing protein [Paracoccus sp. 22332]|uniref:phage tail sheath subtilisin-like domain-containing protein n=1 Tax=Paracoccus sp. 22332 TaxID=3453913 RepID=UPI003F830669
MSIPTADLPAGVAFNRPIAIRKASDAADLPESVQGEIDTALDNGASTIIVVLTDAGDEDAERTANAVGNATTKTGVHAFKSAAMLGLPRPKLLVLPGFRAASEAPANAVIAEAIVVANDLRAQLYVDGPGTTIAAAKLAVPLIGAQKRVCISDGPILKSDDGVTVAHPSSTAFAAVQSMLDQQRSPAWAHTNVLLEGIVGVSLPVEYGTEASELNEAGVNTIINRGDGFRTWGPMTAAVGTIWEFVNVVRVTDMVHESLEDAFIAYIGRPMTKDNLDLMSMTGRGLLKQLEVEGVLLPGSQFGLSTDNLPETGVQGIVKFAMAFEVPAPIYDLRIQAHRQINVAYTALFNSVTGRFETDDAL